MKNFYFTNSKESHTSTDAFLARLPGGITSKHRLLNELSTLLRFPDYFGENWDALWDCLSDLSWISEKAIFIIHIDLPEISHSDLKVYLRTLSEATDDWK